MSRETPTDRAGAQHASDRRRSAFGNRQARHGWVEALVVVLAGFLVMAVVAALGLWAAGAAGLPGAAFPRVVAGVVVMAVGGSVRFSGDAGALAETRADMSVVPLSVTVAGALVIAAGILRPLRHRAVAGARELAGWGGRLAVLWVLALVGLSFLARQTFAVPAGSETLSDIGELLDISPRIGFETDLPLTLLFGLLWLVGLFVLTLLVSRRAPLPARLLRFQESVRPAAFAMVVMLLVCVALGAVIGLVSAAAQGGAADKLAVVLLCLPNLMWLALTVGLGASWEGRVEGQPFELPMPHALDTVLRNADDSTLNLRSLTEIDGRWWWLAVAAGILVLACAFLMAARSPAHMRAWQHGVHMAVALALTVLTICLLGRVSAHFALSVLGIGDLGGGLSGEVSLRPQLWTALGFAVLWGFIGGFLGGLLARPVHRRGEVRAAGRPTAAHRA
ncbi:streptophobe family protein [Streptomyces sp. NPDC002896]|uniref:streptophobe family protein n=1 Tax=Streptomyces sp. NPDC002896 TaxID=3154438 RepID=UPI003331A202